MSILFNDLNDPILKSVIHYSVKFCNSNKLCITAKYKNVNKEKVFFYLQPGNYDLNYKDNKIVINYIEKGNPISSEGTITVYKELYVISETNNFKILEDFIKESVKYYQNNILDKKKKVDKINYYMWDDYWDNIQKKCKRNLDTLCFSDNLHLNLLEDIKTFLSPEEENEYRKYGIPYKYNALLEGYPGTGKTSLITAIASELDLNIATISFDAEMTDRAFMRALKLMPDDTILLLEDIDVLFKERKENDNYKSSLSFSGLINSLDGLGSVDRLIIFMTTNYCCNLDEALKRPGRIDKKIHFDYCKKDQVKLMYNKFLEKRENKFNLFYNEIKSYNITTAMLQKYFFENRKESDLLKNIENLKSISKDQNYDGNKYNIYN